MPSDLLSIVSPDQVLVGPFISGMEPSGNLGKFLSRHMDETLESESFIIGSKKWGALIARQPFESVIFSRPMGKIIGSWGQPDDCDDLLTDVLSGSQQRGINHLSVRVDAAHTWFIQALERHRFYLVDTQATLIRPLKDDSTYTRKNDLEIDVFHPQDLEPIKFLSRSAFGLSRFYQDPNLSTRSADELHRQWATNDCNGRADVTLVARQQGTVLGFIACFFHQPEPEVGLPGQAEIDLIGVSQDYRGQGVGTALVQKALKHYRKRAERMFVLTQENNLPAINLYIGCGFRMNSLAVTLHWSV